MKSNIYSTEGLTGNGKSPKLGTSGKVPTRPSYENSRGEITGTGEEGGKEGALGPLSLLLFPSTPHPLSLYEVAFLAKLKENDVILSD